MEGCIARHYPSTSLALLRKATNSRCASLEGRILGMLPYETIPTPNSFHSDSVQAPVAFRCDKDTNHSEHQPVNDG